MSIENKVIQSIKSQESGSIELHSISPGGSNLLTGRTLASLLTSLNAPKDLSCNYDKGSLNPTTKQHWDWLDSIDNLLIELEVEIQLNSQSEAYAVCLFEGKFRDGSTGDSLRDKASIAKEKATNEMQRRLSGYGIR